MKKIVPWLIATLFFAYQYVLRVLPNIVIDDVMTKFNISSIALGQVTGLYYITYTLLHIPVGIMLDRIGAKKMIFIGSLLVVVGMLPVVYTSSVTLLIFGKLLLGGASSIGILGLLKVIMDLFAKKDFSLIFGISVFVALIAAMYAGQPLDHCIHTFGWNTTFSTLLIVGTLIAFSAYFLIPEKIETTKKVPVVETLSELFSVKKWLIISMIGGLMIGPMEGFADSWATKFFTIVYPGMTPSMAAFLPSLLLLGLAFGAPILGFITARFGNYYSLLTLCSCTMLIGFQLLFYGQLSTNWLFAVLFAIGIASSYQTLVIYLASTMVPSSCTGTAAACANMIMMAFGYFFHSTIGAVIGDGITDPEKIISGLSVITYCLAVSVFAIPLFSKFCAKDKK